MFERHLGVFFYDSMPTYRKIAYTYANGIEKLEGCLYDLGVIVWAFLNV